MVNDLLEIGRLEKGKTRIYPRESTVEEIFSGLRGMLRPILKEKELPLIFDKSSKGRRTSGRFGGTGLGLAICREILNAHKGEIYTKNEEEKGARISFPLPLEMEEE